MQRRHSSFVVVAGVFVVAAVVAITLGATRGSGKSADATTGRDAPITILWIGDTTGPVKVYGDVQLAGAKGAADYFNSHGGIDGHRVTVRAVSDNGDPAIAASVLAQQLAASTPTMIWAGSTSTEAGALIPALAKHDVLAVTLADGKAQCQLHASVDCPNTWALVVPSNVAPQTAVDWLKGRHVPVVGLLEDSSAYTATETPQFITAAAKAGIAVKTASLPAATVDITPELQALKQAGARAVYAEGIGTAKYAFVARANLGWNVPLLFDPPASALDLTKLTTAANIANAYEVTPYEEDPSIANHGLATMVTWASRYANVSAIPLNVTTLGWDAVVALNAAVTKAHGSLDPKKLGQAMLALPSVDPLRTFTHQLGFTNNDHEDVLGAADDYVVIPVGPLVAGRIQAP
jgi:ABC-type branched-subunit amino acid transport system substrate-binding protein